MPPLLPRKDGKQPKKKSLFEALDAPTNSTSIEEIKNSKFCAESLSSSDESSLSELDTTPSRAGSGNNDDSGDDEDEDVNWEDAIAEDTATQAPILRDLDITLEKNEGTFTSSLSSKKGPSKIERAIRIQTHCMHVQFLLFHNVVRNSWMNNRELHQILRDQLPEGIRKEVKRWKIAAGLEKGEVGTPKGRKAKGKGNGKARDRDWGSGSTPMEPNEPDISRGDPTIHLLKVLAIYWRNRFNITAPGLRKKGYRPIPILEAEINSFNRQTDGGAKHGERISDVSEFRELAQASSGSRDVGAQLFTALLRALDIEARMVASLQPIGFGWTKGENYTAKEQAKESEIESDSESNPADESEGSSKKRKRKAALPKAKKIDNDLPFPIYWTEVVSPVTNEVIPVESIVLPNPVATTPELLATFEPRGAKAEKAKQVIAYVVAYSPDATAKDVTIRYLKRQMWPGKTKGYRIPVEKVFLDKYASFDDDEYFTYDWFKAAMRGYIRPQNKRTAADEKEDNVSLAPKQVERKVLQQRDTLQSLRTSTEFVLERFLRREEAIRPGAIHDRIFTTGKGAKKKEEKVYLRTDVEKCLSAESWHKEGRRVKVGESPLKLVPIRAVTLNRKREVDELERETGQKPKQGLYALRQTEYIIPPPITDGVIPKNAYGNIDCFVPTMVPEGAVHIPWPATLRICRKLGVDCAEAVTGFEFGSKMAVPVIQGVVVAEENEELVKDAWHIDAAEKRKKEKLKQDKLILSTWRKFIMGLRITERLQEEYGDPVEAESRNFRDRGRSNSPSRIEDDGDVHETGGGFLVPGQDDEGSTDDLGIESHRHPRGQIQPSEPMDIDDVDENATPSELSDAPSIVSLSP